VNGEEVRKDRYIILTIVLVGVFMSVLDAVVVNIALPDITTYFQMNVADSQWVVTTYLVAQTSFLIIAAKISERVGRARMFSVGLALFTVSSLLCALSGSMAQLIVFRLLQGLGASMLFSISAALIFQVFGHKERGKAMGFLGSTVAVAGMVGPVIGGFLVGTLGWQYIFLINVPVGAVALVAALKMLKVEEHCTDCLHMDYPGAVLWVAAIVSLMLVLGSVGQTGSLTPLALVYLLVSAGAIGLFVRRERRAPYPLLDISVFRVRRFTLAGLSMTMFFISISMVSILGPFYYEGVLNYRPEQVGLIFVVLPAVMMFGSPIAGRMYDRTHSLYYASAGQAIRGLSLLLLAYGTFTLDVPLTLVAFFIMGIGGSLFQSPNNTELMISLPREKSGVASSVQATVRNLSMAVGISLATILMTLLIGSMDYSAIAGGPLAGELASAVSIAVAVSGALSLVGALLSYHKLTGPGTGVPQA
jgi:EmrB/QacA subfamily drug resistance transporter